MSDEICVELCYGNCSSTLNQEKLWGFFVLHIIILLITLSYLCAALDLVSYFLLVIKQKINGGSFYSFICTYTLLILASACLSRWSTLYLLVKELF